jgi:hypothetical protein
MNARRLTIVNACPDDSHIRRAFERLARVGFWSTMLLPGKGTFCNGNSAGLRLS